MIEALRAIGTEDDLPVPEMLYGPTAPVRRFPTPGVVGFRGISGTTTPMDSMTSWEEDEFDDVEDSGDDFN